MINIGPFEGKSCIHYMPVRFIMVHSLCQSHNLTGIERIFENNIKGELYLSSLELDMLFFSYGNNFEYVVRTL